MSPIAAWPTPGCSATQVSSTARVWQTVSCRCLSHCGKDAGVYSCASLGNCEQPTVTVSVLMADRPGRLGVPYGAPPRQESAGKEPAMVLSPGTLGRARPLDPPNLYLRVAEHGSRRSCGHRRR